MSRKKSEVRPPSKVEALEFRCILCTSTNDENDNYNTLTHKLSTPGHGWTSEENCEFPQEIILTLTGKVNLWKLQFMPHSKFIPKKIDIYVGNTDADDIDETRDLQRAQNARYTRVGTMNMIHEERYFPEEKAFFIEFIGEFVRLLIHENYPSKKDNGHNQPRTVETSQSPATPAAPTTVIAQSQTVSATNVGDDALTSVRALRNVCRRLLACSQTKDQVVRAVMCQEAIGKLEQTEDDLLSIKPKHAVASADGDVSRAEHYQLMMTELKEAVFRTVHADLILIEAQKANVDEPQYERSTDVSSKPSIIIDSSEKTTNNIEIKRRESHKSLPVAGNDDDYKRPVANNNRKKVVEPKTDAASEVKPPVTAVLPTPTVISEETAVKDQPQKEATGPAVPADPKEEAKQACPFCGERNELFRNDAKRDSHFADYCPMLHRCQYCHKAIEVRRLNEHYISGRCAFLGDSLTACQRCSHAVSPQELARNDGGHLNCKKVMPDAGMAYCSLCNETVKDTGDGWRRHLIGADGCVENGRRTTGGVGGGDAPTAEKAA